MTNDLLRKVKSQYWTSKKGTEGVFFAVSVGACFINLFCWINFLFWYFSRLACMKLEEYQTAKAALETGASLAPGESRFTKLMKECDESIAGKLVLSNLALLSFLKSCKF